MTTSFLILSNTVARGNESMPRQFGMIYAKLKPVLKKHGLTHDKTVKLMTPKLDGVDKADGWKAMAAYVKPIKDRTAFCADFATVFLALPVTTERVKGMQTLWKSNELVDLKTSGDRAGGYRKVKSVFGPRRVRMDFRKTKQGWRIHVNTPAARKSTKK